MSFLLQLAIPELVLRWSDETPIKPGFKKSHVGSTGKGPFGGLRTSVFSLFAISSSARESGVLPAPPIPRQGPSGPLFPGDRCCSDTDRCLGGVGTPLNASVLTDLLDLPRLGKGIRLGAKTKPCLRCGKNKDATKCPQGYGRDSTNDKAPKTTEDKRGQISPQEK